MSARTESPEPPARYPGRELEVFLLAVRWKAYWISHIAPYVSGDVLEVGAGIGSNTALLLGPAVTSWLCLEPDPDFALRLKQSTGTLPNCSVVEGTTRNLAGRRFDTILYADVLEHIADDRAELERAGRMLRPGGRLIVLSPAHQRLFSPFDRSIGHVRRYSRAALEACGPENCTLSRLFFLDCMGIPVLFANKLISRRSLPTAAQIRFWDGALVPLSQLVDPLFGHRLGKTIIAIWTRRS